MTIRSLTTSLSNYFFEPVSPYPVAVFRILFGLCVCATLLLLHGDWLSWFGMHGWISVETTARAEDGFRLSLFGLIPQDDRWIEGLYWLFLTASLTLTVGLMTRLSNVIVFLALNSLLQRLPLILHGGDSFLRIAGFFLMFASSGAVLSVDAMIAARGKSSGRETYPLIPPWPQRLIQFQLAIVYLASFCAKAKGHTWWNGSALFYVLNLREIHRFPIPSFFHDVWIMRIGTWSALAFELLFPLLVWFKPLRKPMLIAGLLFHLSLEYALNIPMFQWDMLSAYVLFIDFGWIEKPQRASAGRKDSKKRALRSTEWDFGQDDSGVVSKLVSK